MKRMLFIVIILCLSIACTKGKSSDEKLYSITSAVSAVRDGAVIVDVRKEKDRQEDGFLKYSVHIPLDAFSERISDVSEDKSQKIVIYSGDDRDSTEAQEILLENGYRNVIGGLSYKDLAKHIS